MLNAPIGVAQLGSYCAHSALLRMANHRFDPTGFVDRDVAVKEQQDIAIDLLRSHVHHPRV